VKAGHVNGANTHNVSATISIDESRHYQSPLVEFDSGSMIASVPCEPGKLSWNEWKAVGEWMWTNREVYNGLSVLPAFNHTYKQAPFEDITEEEYNNRLNSLKSLDLTKVTELDDTVDFGAIQACGGGQCEVNI
jgi:ribonucleoside-diphosphate reductase alpha chain